MQQCEWCNITFTDTDAYQIHLGVGAPAFHVCNGPNEMLSKGMAQNAAGEWSIDKSLIVHYQGWASLKSNWASGTIFCSACGNPVDGNHTHDGKRYCSYCYVS